VTLLVVDASVVLKWFLIEDGRPEAMTLQSAHDVLAPDLVIAETLNGLWKAVRKNLVPRAQFDAIVPLLGRSFSRLVPSAELAERAWEITMSLDHPVYDAFYVALAWREECQFVTADKRLLQKVQGTSLAKVVRPLLASR
jgi:predicted nucleic acid-binding protein